ncbi:MAG: tetratricopeptide repeat protein, partial [Gammaproteobacteria bacterium]|nr:tetratricopeptide repeat protein [Gammaproteobacteria bacterium]
LEKLRKWWDANGNALIAGVTLGLASLFGWRYWVDYQDRRAEEASVNYEQFMKLLDTGNLDDGRLAGEVIVESYPKSTYAVLTSLLLAKVAVLQEDSSEAIARLTWARDNADSAEVKAIASSRLARVHLADGDAQAALEVMRAADLLDSPLDAELLGDIHQALGQADTARDYYRQALAEASSAGRDSAILQLKVDSLAAAQSGAD